MGGLARDLFEGESGPSRSLAPPVQARLIVEWLRVAEQTGAPLDPLMWVEGPLRSTYPACMAVKAAAEQADDGAYGYLRRLREGIMCARRRVDHAEPLTEEARAAGLDVERFRIDLRSNATTEAFAADLDATGALAQADDGDAGTGAPGSRTAAGAILPTLVLIGQDGERRVLAGVQSFDAYRDAAAALGAVPSGEGPPSPEQLVDRFGTVTTREVEEVCELPGPRAAAELWRLAGEWKLRSRKCLTGELWERA